MTEQVTAVVEPVVATTKPKKAPSRNKPKRQPRYNVILWDDDDHSYDYVIRMLEELFHHPTTRAYKMAKEVDSTGRVIVYTTTMELAELKRDQIHAFGKDALISRCKGSMKATIEPAPGE